jgi:DNA-binding FadR family transcriptional regulator
LTAVTSAPFAEPSPPPPELLRRIVSGALAPGAELPPLDDAERCALERRGLVEHRADGSTLVAEATRWNLLDPDVVRAVLRGDGAIALIAETIDALRMLLTAAARFAADRATGADRERLQRALAALQVQATADGLGPDYAGERLAVYQAIARAAHNRPLSIAAEPLLIAVETFGFPGRDADEAATADPFELELVVDAIVLGDAQKAASAMGAHLRRLGERLTGVAG